MNESDRWNYLLRLDEEFLVGDVVLSEWCSMIVQEADKAYARGAFLASILTAVSGIETYLRSEFGGSRKRLIHLIDEAPISDELKAKLHELRCYRNKWVHIEEPWDDRNLLEHPQHFEADLEEKAHFAARVLRETIYLRQGL
jgi:hypothetical protein